MNKKELQNKIEDLEKQLVELKREVNPIEDEEAKKDVREVNPIEDEQAKKHVRQMPRVGDIYSYIDSCGHVERDCWTNHAADLFRFNTGNCFKTEQEAKDYKENLLTKQALKDLALELNNGVEIDWSDENQNKYAITFENDFEMLDYFANIFNKDLGQIYCLDYRFLTKATVRIGKEKLIKLIKSGV